MEITIEELNALTGDRVSASMKITELERKNDCLTREIERVNQELAVALERQTSMNKCLHLPCEPLARRKP